MITINELLPIQQETIDQEFVQTVNARGLHEFLESRQDFSTWIKNRIKKYDFEEDKDFIRFHKKMEADNATFGLSFDSKLINLIREGIENE